MKDRAFTLIELLIVIAIIAILALIALPNFLEAQIRADAARAKADMRSLASAIEMYFVDNNAYPVCDIADLPQYGVNHWRTWGWFIDLKSDPPDKSKDLGYSCLTTPIGYISNYCYDPFQPRFQPGYANLKWRNYSYFFTNFQGAAAIFATGNYVPGGKGFTGETITAPAPVRVNGVGNTDNSGQLYPTNWALISVGPDRFTGNPGAPGSDYTLWLRDRVQWRHLRQGNARQYDPTNGTVSTGEIFRFSGNGLD